MTTLLKKAAIAAAVVLTASGCEYGGSCGKMHHKMDMDYTMVHFGFDRHDLTSHAVMKLDQQVHYLKHHTGESAMIAGHTDERGSREYNLALGARRANAVKGYLVSKGIDADRIETVSYGKEKPMDPRHNEEAWAKNRRAVTMVGKDGHHMGAHHKHAH